jgi:protein-L-isoaspartate(D-aspartate) O-methyltransferase
LALFRTFFADLVTANVGATNGRLKMAFASTFRERFLGNGPWRVFTAAGYISTPSDDPAFLYQDITVALEDAGSINNGQPTLHALCLAALNIQEGEAVVHIGAGTGYYTALLSKLAGLSGSVDAFEIESRLAERAVRNLADLGNVIVHNRSGSTTQLPACDVIYVNAGATAPHNNWLEALRSGGRLLFPLTPAQGPGAMLLVKRTPSDELEAQFLCRAMFIPCAGARDETIAQHLSDVFADKDLGAVRSLRCDTTPDETCWFQATDWWLSTDVHPTDRVRLCGQVLAL